jgi:hypothetical protein
VLALLSMDLHAPTLFELSPFRASISNADRLPQVAVLIAVVLDPHRSRRISAARGGRVSNIRTSFWLYADRARASPSKAGRHLVLWPLARPTSGLRVIHHNTCDDSQDPAATPGPPLRRMRYRAG